MKIMNQKLGIMILVLFLAPFSLQKEKLKFETASKTLAQNTNIYGNLWKELFTVPRTTACSKKRLLKRIRKQLEEEGLLGQRTKKKPFAWVLQWGYGQASYFFDYLDPVLRDEVVKQYKGIWELAKTFPNVDSSYPDPFDFKNLITQDNAKLTKKVQQQLKLFTKNFDENIYNLSINAVQVKKAMNTFKWYVDPVNPNYPQKFVMKYDMNFDGRLNPREFILASIWHNKQMIGIPPPVCEQCFFEVGKMIDAIFLYLDCDNDGFLSAEEIWKNLPNLNRKTETFNMFAFGVDTSIRTAAINDFILKHTNSKDGYISRREFKIGILLGYWDRQTEKDKILDNDSRTMKNLRWTENNMIDVALYRYYKTKMAKSG
jgi:EF hand